MTTIKMAFPYLSQINGIGAGGYRNDCGPTCCWMLLQGFGLLQKGETVDSLYRSVVKNGDRYTSWQENIKILQNHGVYPAYGWDLKITDVEHSLQNGYAVMALIHYGVLQQAMQTYSGFTGNHFLLVVGMEKNVFLIHDPLWLNEGGKYLRVEKSDFEKAWIAAEGAKASALKMTKKLGELSMEKYVGTVLSSIGLNLRSGAGINYDIVGRLAFNEEIFIETILALDNGDVWGKLAGSDVWCAIRYQDSEMMAVKVLEESPVDEDKNEVKTIEERIITAIDLLNETLVMLR